MKDAPVIGIIGKRGYGKSVTAKKLVSEEKRLFVFDPLMSNDYNVNFCSREQLVKLHDENAFGIQKDIDINKDGYVIHEKLKTFRYGITESDDLGILASLSFLSGDNTLVIEECAIAFENPAVKLDRWWRELIFMGRHRNVTLIFIAQRPISIPIGARSQFNRVITFAHHEGSDVSWLKEYFGDRYYEIPELKRLECLDSDEGDISRYSIQHLIKDSKKPINTDSNNALQEQE